MQDEELRIPTVFMRGGTSKALVFHARDLPTPATPGDTSQWIPIFLAAMGSPDPSGRQLNGIGGGVSSLSKIAVVGPSTREDADVDYTFGQVAIAESVVGFRGNCGNISSAIGPFAVDEGLVKTEGSSAVVRIHNTNTGKIIVSRFPLTNGRAAVSGEYALDGVAGTGAKIELNFQDPGGAATGSLMPSGNSVDTLKLEDGREITASLIDAANPVVFVSADSLGLEGTETPQQLNDSQQLMLLFEDIRCQAALAMGLVETLTAAKTKLKNLPLVSVVSSPRTYRVLSGEQIDLGEIDILTRMISAGQPHRAVPLTGAMCLAIAAKIPGSVVNQAMGRSADGAGEVRIGHPSGKISVASQVARKDGAMIAVEATVFRTARRLMEGHVLVPARVLPQTGSADVR